MRTGRGSFAQAPTPASAPFAALPHDIAADPRLSPTDVRVLLALLYWARSKPVCWPSDRSIALRIGRSVGTVQRSLRRLEAFGLVERRRADNPTGRELVLRWRSSPTAPALDPPASRARDEGECEEKENQPSSAACREGTPPPAEETMGPEAPPPAEDLERFYGWAAGPDPALARFGRAALRLAGVDPAAVAQPVDTPSLGPVPAVEASPLAPPAPVVEVAAPAPSIRMSPARPTTAATPPVSHPYSQGLPRSVSEPARLRTPFPAPPRRVGPGPRHVLEQLVDGTPVRLPVRVIRASP
jgi:hypothetical protein